MSDNWQEANVRIKKKNAFDKNIYKIYINVLIIYRLTNIYKKMKKANAALAFFANNQWEFSDNNTSSLWKEMSEADKKTFFFDIKEMSWDYYARACAIGLRLYLVKDDIHTIKNARIKWEK